MEPTAEQNRHTLRMVVMGEQVALGLSYQYAERIAKSVDTLTDEQVLDILKESKLR